MNAPQSDQWTREDLINEIGDIILHSRDQSTGDVECAAKVVTWLHNNVVTLPKSKGQKITTSLTTEHAPGWRSRLARFLFRCVFSPVLMTLNPKGTHVKMEGKG